MKHPPGRVIAFCEHMAIGDEKDCIQWATEVLCSGEDSPSLCILAGLGESSDADEVRKYCLRTFEELGYDIPSRCDLVDLISRDLVEGILHNPSTMRDNLWCLSDLYNSEDFPKKLQDFFLLRWALDDLKEDEVQWYWDGADRSNIEETILTKCREWLTQHNLNTEQDSPSLTGAD